MQHMVWATDFGEHSFVFNRTGNILVVWDMWHLWVGVALGVVQRGIAEKSLKALLGLSRWFVHLLLVFFKDVKLFLSAYSSLQFYGVLMLGNACERYYFLEVILKVAFNTHLFLFCLWLLLGFGECCVWFCKVNKGKIAWFFDLNKWGPRVGH